MNKQQEFIRAIINNSENDESVYRETYAIINNYKAIKVGVEEWQNLKSKSRKYLKSFVDGEALVLEYSRQLIMLDENVIRSGLSSRKRIYSFGSSSRKRIARYGLSSSERVYSFRSSSSKRIG